MRSIDIGSWLKELGLERYTQAFADNDIDADTLHLLTERDLEELGVSSDRHRQRLLAAIASMNAPVPIPMATGTGPVRPTAEILAERRAVTVLFCDIADFDRLSREHDAEDLHALLERYFETVDGLVQRYGGHVDKHIGDTVMAVFGAPVAHTNDPERAVRAAVDIRRAVRQLRPPLRVRAGIASGAVIASPTGSQAHVEYTVTGSAVNLAARLHELAGADDILISGPVRSAVTTLANDATAQEVTLKGIDAPVAVWRLEGLRAEASPAAQAPLIGRDAELEALGRRLALCRQRSSGHVLHVRGEPGIGKTRLVEELRAMAQAQGFTCHIGHVVDFGDAHGPIAALVCSLLSLPATSPAAARRDAARTALYLGMAPKTSDVFLHDLLDVPQPGPQRLRYDAMSPAGRSRGKRHTLVELLRYRAARRPQLLLLEDVHWADTEVTGYIEHLAGAVADLPALLVLTSRVQGDPLAALAGNRELPITTLELQPLSRQDARALAAHLAEDSGALAGCVERADGNPLFLEQLLRSADGSAAESLPDSIQSVVQARIDHLDPADKQALLAASVLGQRFTLDALRFLIGDADYTCDALVAHQLVRAAGDEHVFAHALVLEGVYSSMLRGRQRSLHARAAAWYADTSPMVAAEHLERAEDARAALAYLDAARSQATEYRFERALQLCERGLALCAQAPAQHAATEHALRLQQAEVLRIIGQLAAALAELERALAMAGDDVARCRTWIGQAEILRISDDSDRALELLARAQEVATAHGLAAELASIHTLRGNLLFPRGDIDGCLAQQTAALGHARQAGSVAREAQALSGLGDAYYLRGRMITAHGHFARCVELCRAHGLGSIELANLSMRGMTRFYQGDLAGGLDDAVDDATVAALVGHKRAELVARSGCIGVILIEMDRLDEAREEQEAALALAQSLGASRFEPGALSFLAKILALQGQADAAAVARAAVARSREVGMTFVGPMALAALALASDDAAVQRAALDEGEAMLGPGTMGHNHLFFYRDAMEVALRAGQPDELERHARALEDYTRPEPLPWSRLYIARGRALAAHLRGARDHDHGILLARLYEEAVRMGMQLAAHALARALADL